MKRTWWTMGVLFFLKTELGGLVVMCMFFGPYFFRTAARIRLRSDTVATPFCWQLLITCNCHSTMWLCSVCGYGLLIWHRHPHADKNMVLKWFRWLKNAPPEYWACNASETGIGRKTSQAVDHGRTCSSWSSNFEISAWHFLGKSAIQKRTGSGHMRDWDQILHLLNPNYIPQGANMRTAVSWGKNPIMPIPRNLLC